MSLPRSRAKRHRVAERIAPRVPQNPTNCSRATRVLMCGNHTTFFNTEADDVAVGPSAIRSRRHTCDYTSMQHRSDG
jgi:hypothetical protein